MLKLAQLHCRHSDWRPEKLISRILLFYGCRNKSFISGRGGGFRAAELWAAINWANRPAGAFAIIWSPSVCWWTHHYSSLANRLEIIYIRRIRAREEQSPPPATLAIVSAVIISRILFHFIPIDSPFSALTNIFWVQNDLRINSTANCQQNSANLLRVRKC
jgi:hypothetical protein